MQNNFDNAFDLVLRHEGGYVDHPNDNGGATNLGITIGVLSAWLGREATKAEVSALTLSDVKPIYKKNYWDKIKADEIHSGLDYALFDYAVNSGPGRAAREIQRIVGTGVDGVIGTNTLAAINAVSDVAGLIDKLCDARMAFLRGLNGPSGFPTFGRGWTRRVSEVRVKAVGMVDGRRPPRTIPPAEAGAAAVGTAIIVAGSTDPAIDPVLNQFIIGFGIVLIIAAVATFLFKRKKNGTS